MVSRMRSNDESRRGSIQPQQLVTDLVPEIWDLGFGSLDFGSAKFLKCKLNKAFLHFLPNF